MDTLIAARTVALGLKPQAVLVLRIFVKVNALLLVEHTKLTSASSNITMVSLIMKDAQTKNTASIWALFPFNTLTLVATIAKS